MDLQQVRTRITVGYDGTASSVTAVEWAAHEAELRDAQLSLVYCCSTSAAMGSSIGSCFAVTFDPRDIERASRLQVESMAAEMHRRHPDLECSAEASPGSPRDVLVDASDASALMVVGMTRSGALSRLVGSVAGAVIRRSRCPVVSVPSWSTSRTRFNRVVVGVDGSPPSVTALRWATEEAARRDAELVLIHAWRLAFSSPAVVHEAERVVVEAEAAALLVGMMQSRPAGERRRSASGALVEDHAATALLAAAESADLVVVGSRGQGGVRSRLSGSIAQVLTEHAPCPVAVIHRDLTVPWENRRPTDLQLRP
ncbi:MAG: universal stress protein [Acidimicrobiia bacterium]